MLVVQVLHIASIEISFISLDFHLYSSRHVNILIFNI